MKKSIMSILILLYCLVLIASGCFVSAETNGVSQNEEINQNIETTGLESSYFDYYNTYKNEKHPESSLELMAEEAKVLTPNALKTIDGKPAVVFENTDSFAQWSFEIIESGVYSLYPTYYALDGTGKDIVLSVSVDGKAPYTECKSFSLNRFWKDSVSGKGDTFVKDSEGDDMRPMQIEVRRWCEKPFSDLLGLYSEPYLFFFESGKHTLRIDLVGEAIAIAGIKIANEKEPISYSKYHSAHTKDDIAKVDEVIFLQAETPIEKSSQTLYPVYDRTSAATMPNDPVNVRLNTIGQNNWNSVGQSISWKVNVPKAGLYKIAFRAKQNYNSGMNSYRTLYINGEIPFKEAQNIVFPYKQGWQIVNLGGQNSYYVWLNPGDTITLECKAGRMSTVLRNLQQVVLELNELYRKIIVVTGSSPDIYRDYHLEDQIPELAQTLKNTGDRLEKIIDVMNKLNGGKSPLSATVKMMSTMALELADDTYYIPERLANFKSNIESLGSLIKTLGEQPLELDYICFLPYGVEQPKAKAGFFSSIAYSTKQFLTSFVKDYDGVFKNKKKIEVWVATGRDQAQILKNMIDDSFTPKTKVDVKVSLVDTGTNLIKATLANKGPDVAIMIPEDTPVNLAMRGMLLDLSKYVDESDLKDFRTSALTPFYFNGGLYALPETETFDMLFYRKDILKELELEVPETWEDFYSLIKVLQLNNLNVGVAEINAGNMGISAGIGTFCKFLFQNGGTYYNDKLTTTLFDTPVAQDAFTKWVELYSLYKLDRSFDFFNCFRSGEMPIAINSYTAYNQLSEAAPEIRGLWDFAPIPGTLKADGTIDRSQSSAVTGCIVINSAEKNNVAEESVEFIKWWTSEEIQARFGRELEAILGVSARYATASLGAAEKLGWSVTEWQTISKQGESIVNVPQIPGNYMVNRALTNAFRAALKGTNTPSRSLNLYNKDICREITRKRTEFGLS